MGTVFSGGKEANWFAPKGDSKAAKGVILFMHGFAQGPNAYYENLQGLADAGFLVVAPLPPFGVTPSGQQTDMVDYAAYFHSKIISNTLTGLPLSSAAVANNIGLLGHSVGAGLATYVAKQAATEGRPFKAVMYLAPQTEVFRDYDPEAAINGWPAKDKSTEFGLQYGLKDELAPPDLSLRLVDDIRKKGLTLKPDDLKCFEDGTHVGFEDQVVLADAEVTSDILPWLNPLLLWLLSSLGVPFLPLLLRTVYRKRQAAAGLQLGAQQGEQRSESRLERLFGKVFLNPQDIALLEQQAIRTERKPLLKGAAPPADGIGPPEEVSIASAEATVAQYIGLLTVTAAATFLFASKAFTDGEVHWLPLLATLVAGYMTYKGGYYLSLQNYVNTVQRPHSREEAKKFFRQYLS